MIVYLYQKNKQAMNTKQILSENKSLIKGLSFQMISGNNTTPYSTLNGIGTAILNEEQSGNEVIISRVITTAGLVTILNPETFVTLLKSGIVEAVCFKSFYNEKTEAEGIRSFGKLD
jgi:hypothetical protein